MCKFVIFEQCGFVSVSNAEHYGPNAAFESIDRFVELVTRGMVELISDHGHWSSERQPAEFATIEIMNGPSDRLVSGKSLLVVHGEPALADPLRFVEQLRALADRVTLKS